MRQGASACTKWQIPTTHFGTSRVHPNTPARAPISMYSQSQGSSVSFSDKSEGNIQARRVVSFVSKSSGVLLLICYFELQIFDIMSHYFSKGQWVVMYKYSTSNVMCHYPPHSVCYRDLLSKIFTNRPIRQRLANRVNGYRFSTWRARRDSRPGNPPGPLPRDAPRLFF